jgi:Leucine-rich repeat (LRR) protein
MDCIVSMGVLSSCCDHPKQPELTLTEEPVHERLEEHPSEIDDLPIDDRMHPELAKIDQCCKEGRGHEVKNLRLLWRDLSGRYCGTLNFLLQQCPNIEELVLKSNDLGAHGMQCLAPGIRSLKSLKKLSIGQNKLADAGLRTLTTLLEGNQELVELTLDNNQITDVEPLVILMVKLPKLKIVWIQSNRIRNADLLLSYRGSTTEVNLAGNPVEESLGAKLREVFPQLII